MPSKEKERNSDRVISIQVKDGNSKIDEREFKLTPVMAKILNVDLLSAPSKLKIKQYNKEKEKIREMKEFFIKYA